MSGWLDFSVTPVRVAKFYSFLAQHIMNRRGTGVQLIVSCSCLSACSLESAQSITG